MKNIIAALSIVLLGSIALANPKIGPAGCGLGNLVMGGDSNQVLAYTTNGTGVQTFGITSGTSNCGGLSATAQLENYIDVNRMALASDMSRGQGETLDGLTSLLNCAHPKAAHQSLKNNYQSIFPSQNVPAQDVTRQIERSIPAEASCHIG